jgi:acyl-coenzyme A synthetase/AMP-(fatty) acid ligase
MEGKSDSEAPVLQMLKSFSHKERIAGANIAVAVQFDCFHELLPARGSADCIVSADDRASLSYEALNQFVTVEFPKLLREIAPKSNRCRISPVLPNGPEAAVCLIACVSAACCAPINHNNTEKEVSEELKSFKSEFVVVLAGQDNDHIFAASAALGVPVVILAPSPTHCGLFSVL